MLKDYLRANLINLVFLAGILSISFFNHFSHCMEAPPHFPKENETKEQSHKMSQEEANALLYKAAARGNVNDARCALDAGADINIDEIDTENQSYVDETPLLIAARSGHAGVVNFLLENGADPHGGGRYSPVYVAADNGHSDIVRIFFERGIFIEMSPAATRADGRLINAIIKGDEQAAHAALADDAYVNARDASNRTPLHWAVTCGHANLVKLLLERGAHYDTSDEHGTPLHDAARRGNYEVVQILIDKDVNVDVCSERLQQTPLHVAARHGHDRVVQLLLDRGAGVNYVDEWGHMTPLHQAARGGSCKVAKLLLAKGADIALRDHNNQTALHNAAENGNCDVARLLLAAGACINDKSGLNLAGWTPLHFAVSRNHTEMIRLLLDAGADTGASDISVTPSSFVLTLLGLAATCGNCELLQVLLDRGVNQVNLDLALEQAVLSHLYEAARLLLEKGAHTKNVLAQCMHSGFLSSKENKIYPLVQLLLDYGADVRGLDQGITCLDCALEKKYQKIAQMLLRYVAKSAIQKIDMDSKLLETDLDALKTWPQEDLKEALVVAAAQGHEEQVIHLLRYFVSTQGPHASIEEALTMVARLLRTATLTSEERQCYERIQRILSTPTLLANSIPNEKFGVEDRRARAVTQVTSILGRTHITNQERQGYGVIRSILQYPSIPVRSLLIAASQFVRERLCDQSTTQEEKGNYGSLALLMRPTADRPGATITLAMLNRLPKDLLFVVLAHALQSIAKSNLIHKPG
jgi:ankyrin repeat protein